MKFSKKCKKAAVLMAMAILLPCSFTASVFAHGHGGGHHDDNCHGNKGVYCSYHDKFHKKKSNCTKYCKKHKTTHRNGKQHHVRRHH